MVRFPRVFIAAAVLLVAPLSAQQNNAFVEFRESPAWTADSGVYSLREGVTSAPLFTRAYLGDAVVHMEYRAPANVRGQLFLMSRFAVPLPGAGMGANDWQKVSVRFRGPRFSPAFTVSEHALIVEATVGANTIRNVIAAQRDAGSPQDDDEPRGTTAIIVPNGPFEVRHFKIASADFSAINLPEKSGGATNEESLVDFVALGKETFESVGCSACHLVEKSTTAVSSGPNLFGLFLPEPRDREVVEGEGHRFTIKAGKSYLLRSVRAPNDQLAVAETGDTQGQPYLPVMPAFTREVLSDEQIEAIGDYLATLNDDPRTQGPAVKMQARGSTAPYDPMTDSLQFLVDDTVRLQRGPLPGTSGRAIHVGTPAGVNYSFDPRVLAITKVWQGGFLDMSGELTNRGGRGLKLGFESREINFGEQAYLLAPLNAAGEIIDFSFKEAKFGDAATVRESLYSKEEQLDRIQKVDAQFLGYARDSEDKRANPVFRYRVAGNVLEVQTSIDAKGAVEIEVTGELSGPQVFALNPQLLQGARVEGGEFSGSRWTLPEGKAKARLTATMTLAANAWRPAPSNYRPKKNLVLVRPATAKLPAGYSIESLFAPKDNYGRDQLFEALGLDLAQDGTVVVATRTAGIWRLVRNEWRPFAEGTFDSLGVVVEDKEGLVVVAGQKAELTRISDTNGDGIADRYDTLFDAHSYHGNYHTYMHGPTRTPDGAYHFALNLAHDGSNTTYNAGGAYMGTWGGFSGWSFRVEPDGKFSQFAYGLRSPASIGAGPNGRIFYADNQGEYVGTSKLFVLEAGKFFGHPASLVDLPGRTPENALPSWDEIAKTRERPVILFPHNRVANSPGNPTWDTSRGRFGPFSGQMLIGDQTQSNLLRVALQKVGDVEQGSVMPFFEGLESGVMRPLFLPDGTLLLGQTGRGWQAKGGNVAALQRVRWNNRTVAPAIVQMLATPRGFRLQLTQPLRKEVSLDAAKNEISIESWTYRDAPDYGSPELALREDAIKSVTLSPNRKSIDIELTSLDIPQVHAQQTARVYHAKLKSANLFRSNAPAEMHAYYTLHRFPAK